jgi:hypothetical protein
MNTKHLIVLITLSFLLFEVCAQPAGRWELIEKYNPGLFDDDAYSINRTPKFASPVLLEIIREQEELSVNQTGEPLKTSTTLSPYCGGTDIYCSVEFDSTGDGNPDCCDKDNNPACADCLDYCIEECAKDFKGVNTCFRVNDRTVCQCSRTIPSCYDVGFEGLPDVIESEGGTGWSILLILLVGLAILAIMMKTLHKMG